MFNGVAPTAVSQPWGQRWRHAGAESARSHGETGARVLRRLVCWQPVGDSRDQDIEDQRDEWRERSPPLTNAELLRDEDRRCLPTRLLSSPPEFHAGPT